MSIEEKNLTELAAELAKARDDARAAAEEIKGRMENGEKKFDALKEDADAKLKEIGELKARIAEIEQKAARPGGNPDEQKSIGQRFVESESFKDLINVKGGRGTAAIELKAGACPEFCVNG